MKHFTPISMLGTGLAAAVIAGLLELVGFGIDDGAPIIVAGWAIGVLAGVMVTIGVIACGVELGNRAARHQ